MTAPPSPWKRRLVVLGVVLVGLVALVKLALPPLLASRLADAAASALGRRVAIGGLALGWLPGRVVVTDFEIGGPLEAAPIQREHAPVRFERLALDLSWASLLAGEIHLTELSLDAPALFLERDERGALAPLVLAEPDAGDEEAESTDAEAGSGWPIRLDAIAVRDLTLGMARSDGGERRELDLALAELTVSELSLRDGAVSLGAIAFQDPGVRVQRSLAQTRSPGEASPGEASPGAVAARPPAAEAATRDAETGPLARHRLESLEVDGAEFTLLWEGGTPLEVGLDLSASGVSAVPGERFPLEVTLRLEGGSIGLQGELGVNPLAFDGSVQWQELPLARLLDASGVDAGVELASGRSRGALRVALSGAAPADGPPRLELSGDAEVSDLDASLPDLKLAWSTLSVAAESLRVPLGSGEVPVIALTRVALVEPRIDYELVPHAPAVDVSEASAPAGSEDSGPRLSIDALEVDAGTLRFRDRSLQQPFETRWRDLSVRGRGLRWPEQDADSLKISARGTGGAKLAVDASFRGGRGRIETQVDRLALAPLDPYAAEYTGVRISEGRTTLRSVVEIDEKSLRTDSEIDLHQLSVREEEAGWFQRIFGVPLDLALALLRDLEGDIHVPVQAEFAGEESNVGMVSLLASTLRQALMGAVTSPLKLLGSAAKGASAAFGTGLEPIEVVPGQPVLEASQQERLALLAETLEEKPGLLLSLKGRAGPSDDAGIARRRLIAQARAGESLDGENEIGFLERRRVRSALAEQDPDAPGALEPETEALVQKLVAVAQVDDAQRRELARARAARARDALVRELGVSENAVVVEEGAVGEPGVVIQLRARSAAPDAEASG